MEDMKLNILGQDYELVMLSEKEFPKLVSSNASGLAELYDKRLIINKDDTIPDDETFDNLKAYTEKVIRHEIIHAYFHEAGLAKYCNDETLVDWLALQVPKITKTIDEVKYVSDISDIDNREEIKELIKPGKGLVELIYKIYTGKYENKTVTDIIEDLNELIIENK